MITSHRLLALALTALTLVGCRADSIASVDDTTVPTEPTVFNPDWTTATHGNGVAPSYETVFSQTAVQTLEITMTAAQWSSVRTNMRSLYGFDFGAGGGGGGGFPSTDPDYIPVEVTFNGKKWKQVGWRLKGNSSRSTSWRSGTYKLPFRLQFDEYEDDVPAVANQRFFGFRELSFSPGFSDPSLIKDKLASDMFRMAGVNAAQTAFYRLVINFGAGAKYCGVYTVAAVIDDTMVETQFGTDDGNIYKPESNLTTFVQSQFEKKNNETAADYSDVQSFITALNSATRTTNATAWRSSLESTFDMEHFLNRLAVNNAIVNWDTYGSIAHNYYLYNHPTRKLVWIPWDHNESMLGSPGITGTTGGGGQAGRQGVSLSMNEVAATRPLLRYVAADPVYLASYRNHLKTFSNTVLATGAATDMIDRYTALIAPHVTGAGGEQSGYTQLTSQAAFTTAANTLRTHLAARRALITQYVP